MHRIVIAAAVCTLAMLTGCDQREPLAEVIGRVTLQGRPLTEGTVSLRPDANRGNLSLHHPTGRIEPDGRFEIYTHNRQGAAPGWYNVVIFANEPEQHDPASPHPGLPKSLIDTRYHAAETTPLAVEVTIEPGDNEYVFDLEPHGSPKR